MEPLLEDIKVVELAEWGFVPSAGAVLADWGADVIKIEHPQRGDPMRGLMAGGLIASTGDFNYMIEQMNRGKRSIGLDLNKPEGREIFLKFIAKADVFVTSFLEPARERLKVTYEEMSALNPRLIYARGHGQGQRGPDAANAGFDAVSYWARSGIAHMLTAPGSPLVMQRAAFGDVMSGMALAGGIAAALFRRSATGKGGLIDVSLLGTALWNLGPDIIASHLLGQDPRDAHDVSTKFPPNPLVGVQVTKDKRYITLTMMEADRYWAGFCRALDREDLIEDPRYSSFEARAENRKELAALIREAFASRPMAEWAERLAANECIWAAVQAPQEAGSDPQVVANGYLVEHPTNKRGRVVASPVQYNNGMLELERGAPELGQHTEEILQEFDVDWDEITRLKEAGVVT
jgi:crotonobetainyl-CoA:carnitine CoA-transferase CaiB-like acyl-CoA transferase